MVLAELGGRISRALRQISNAMVVDEKVLTDCLNEITRALLQADVQFKMVTSLCTNIRKAVSLEELAPGHDKRRIIQNAVVDELTKMLDSGKPAYTPQKGKTNVVMFVGLQGSGKTTTCTKYARFYQKKGFRSALICADTFRAGAFDQLKQNATKARIPFYGSYTETDPAKIAQEGLETFKREKCDLVIVDTSGRHKQEAALLEEMRQVAVATDPDLVVFVMDGSIGQAAFDQAQAFKQSTHVGAVIVTKMDGHAKGGGALSAVAATTSPIVFIGTGEHMDDFELFDNKTFVKRLLGLGDLSGFLDKIHEVVPVDQQEDFIQSLMQRRFTYRMFQNLIGNITSMGPLSEVMSMVPGLSANIMPKGSEKERQVTINKYMTMMDSMSTAELESTNPNLFAENSRVLRVARGSGRTVRDVQEMQEKYKLWADLKIPKNGNLGAISRNTNARNMSKVLPPQIIRQMGGVGGLQNIMKQIGGSKDFGGMLRVRS